MTCVTSHWAKEVIELKLKGRAKEEICSLNSFLSSHINGGAGELRNIWIQCHCKEKDFVESPIL